MVRIRYPAFSLAMWSNITRYQKERGRTKEFDGFFETARSICEPSTHPDRDSLLAYAAVF